MSDSPLNRLRVETTELLGFPGYRYTNSDLSVTLVPELGGRIMAFGPPGCNLLYNNSEMTGFKPVFAAKSPEDAAAERKRNGFLLHGGEKTWLSPQQDWAGPPYADLDHGRYDWAETMTAQGAEIVLTSPICRETRLRIVRRISIPHAGPGIRIVQRLENHGAGTVTKGLWQVTMLRRPAVVELPVLTSRRSAFEDGIKNFMDTDLYRSKLTRQLHGDGYKLSCDDDTLFKVGTDLGSGTARAVFDLTGADGGRSSVSLVKSFPVTTGPFGHGCMIEVYNSQDRPYLELEVHSPLYRLKPGEAAEYALDWRLAAHS